MTDAEIDALTPERLRKEVALRVMGLCFHKNKTTYGLTYSCLDCGAKHLGRDVVVPDYPGDIRAAWAVEEQIARRGFHREYGNILFKSLRDVGGDGVAFRVAHATPEQRCRAALKAVERMGVQSST